MEVKWTEKNSQIHKKGLNNKLTESEMEESEGEAEAERKLQKQKQEKEEEDKSETERSKHKQKQYDRWENASLAWQINQYQNQHSPSG